jgi:beta-1,2-mannobiose phosphorylase / 1,2-beta-oligomannan phosphorylase
MLFADSSHGRPFSKDPAVVRFAGKYWLYYSLPPYRDGRSPDGWSIGVATSTDLEDWQVQGEIRPEADYEANGLCAPGAIVLNGQVHLFYQTYGNGPKDAICHAVSGDGLSFTRNPSNPIFHPSGDWNAGRAIDADVIPFGDRLLLYFATRDPHMKIQMLGVAGAPLDSDFSRETWVQLCDQPILKPELPWEGECIEAPALFKHDERLFMFYGGGYNNWPQQIGLATSTDGVQWQRVFEQPFLPNGEPGSWNACESGHPFAFTDDDGSVTLFFQGDNDMGHSWYLSPHKIGWRDGLPALV